MIPYQLRDFVNRLVRATNFKQIEWNAGEDRAYFCSNNDLTVHILLIFDEKRGRSSFDFRIDGGAAGPAWFSVFDHEDDFYLMNSLYDAASVSAAKIDDKLNGFFN